MRTTLTLDEDVATLLEKENRKANESMKHTINRVLRCGLAYAAKPVKRPKFVVTPLDLGTAPEQWERWKDMSAQEILDDLDGGFKP